MTIFGGKRRGMLVNSEELCGSKARAAARFVGQNNRVKKLSPKLSIKCKKGNKGKKKTARGKRRGR